jgi:hypothetical protein
LAAAVLKKLSANVVTTTPPQQAAQGSVTGPANIPAPVAPPAPPGPGVTGEPPDVLKAKADAERTAEKVRKESAKIAADAKHATGLNLELTATERAMVVLTPDHGPAASYQMQPGNSVSAMAEQEMKLFTDNAGALQWKMNGKTQPTLGTGHVAASARITPAGAETLWSGDAAAMARKFGKTRPPQGPEAPGAAVANGVDASRIRREVGQQVRAGMVPLRIELRGIPLMLEVFVQIDGKPLLHRPVANEGPGEPEKQRVNEERWIVPGKHEFQVRVGRSDLHTGQMKTVSAEFVPGQQRILRIQILHDGASPGARMQGRLAVTIE